LENLGASVPQRADIPAPSAPAAPSETVPESTIEGSILTLRDTMVTTDLLNDNGIHEGMILEVYHQNTHVGTIRITAIYGGFSTAEIESVVPGHTIQEDDRVCCPVSAR